MIKTLDLPPTPIEGGGVVREAEAGASVRMVLYMNGARDERPRMMGILAERAVGWGEWRGFEVVGSFEDTLEDWSVRERRDLERALTLLADGQAEVLGIPVETYESLSGSDREWLRAACEQYGGRLELVPDLRWGWGHGDVAG